MGDELIKDLRKVIASGSSLIIVGTGVSVSATGNAPTASWRGLIADGIAYAAEINTSLKPNWAKVAADELALGDLDSYISVGEKVTKALGGSGDGMYSRWLRERIGGLKVVNPGLPKAVVALPGIIATCNYDDVLTSASGLPPVTWRNEREAVRLLGSNGPPKSILHLHGHWDDPKSVVLGIRSYESVLGSDLLQLLMRATASLHSLIFVGFGAGLEDPNFHALRSWMSQHLSGTEHRHYRLCLNTEVERLGGVHAFSEHVIPVGHGEDHASLESFLTRIVGGSAQGGPVLRTGPIVGSPGPALFEIPQLGGISRPDVTTRLATTISQSPVLCVTGLSGSGKTYAVSAGLRDLAVPTYWYSPRPGSSFDEFVLDLTRIVRLESLSPLARARELIAHLRVSGRVLVVDDLADTDVASWEPFLVEASSSPGPALVAVVSRLAIDIDLVSAAHLTVEPVTSAEIRELLQLRGVRLDPRGELELLGKTDGLPLAVSVFASLVARGADPDYLLRDELTAASRLQSWMRALIATLPEDAVQLAQVFCQLGVPFSSGAVARIAPSANVQNPHLSLAELGDRFVIEQVGEARWRMHSLFATAISTLLDPTQSQRYLKLLAYDQVGRTQLPSKSARTSDEMRRGLTCADLLLRAGETERAHQFVAACASQAKRSGSYRMLIDVAEPVVMRFNADDQWLNYNLAHCHLITGTPRRGLSVLDRSSPKSDPVLKLSTNRLRAELQYELGETSMARRTLTSEFDSSLRSFGRTKSERTALSQAALCLAGFELSFEQVARAAELVEAAERINQPTPAVARAVVEIRRGQVAMAQGRLFPAERHLTRGKGLFEKVGDKRGLAWSAGQLAALAYKSPTGALRARADHLLMAAVEAHEEIGDCSRSYFEVLKESLKSVDDAHVATRAEAAFELLVRLPHFSR